MIKVRLLPKDNIKVRLRPAQGIKVGLDTTYLYDNSLIADEVELAKDWAIKMTGKVIEEGEEVDYSSKYYASQAKTSETNASASATSASSSASSASTSKDAASASAGLAEQYKNAASSSATSAGNSASSAATSASTATNQATIATNQASTATTQAGVATTKANAASASATSASGYANTAKIWAEGDDEEVEPLGGTHSSLVSAGLSYAYANASEDVPVETFAAEHDLIVQGQKGDNATINGVNALTITATGGLTGTQGGSTYTIDGSAKQDTISDLATIRSGASAGATALQPNTAITAGTHTKITYDSKGLVTAGSDLTASDIPDISATYYLASNPSGYITSSALSGYATQTWVGQQGYITRAVDDSSTSSTTLGWSASKLNTTIGNIESALLALRGNV